MIRIILLLGVFAAQLAFAEERSVAGFIRRAEAGERLNVVWFGGSLTWGANASDPNRTIDVPMVILGITEEY